MKIFISLLRCLPYILSLPLFGEEANLSWHQYDSKNRTEKWILTPEKEIEWVYDATGDRIEWRDWTGITYFSYDSDHFLSEVITPARQKTLYNHDPRGNLLSITYPAGIEIKYTYEPGGVLKTVETQGKRIIYSYDYDRDLLLSKKLPNGITTEYRYDRARRISDIIHTRSNNVLVAHFHFEYDEMNNRILFRKKTPYKEHTVRYVYDRLYRLTEAHSSDGYFEKYTYNAFGDRKTKETPEGIVCYEYDKNARLRKANDIIYDYDESGNLIKKSTPKETISYQYNELGQLIEYKDRLHTVGFTYNGQGERLSKTVDGQTTQYSYEDVFPVFQLLQEKNNKQTKQYFYGHYCLGHCENKKVYYYLEESPGNPIGLIVDEAGNIAEELEYDCFGQCLSSSNASVQYNGEQVDLETGLIFLRTRYYDPEVGRFISPDRVPGDHRNPQSLNRYVYVNNNPLNFRDPIGTAPEPKKDVIQPHGWAKGVPIWQERDPLPPEGMTLVVKCARKGGIFLRDSTKEGIFRKPKQWGGHGWLEFVENDGAITSISTHIGEESNVSRNDFSVYAYDRDTIKISYLVPNSIAQEIKIAANNFSEKDYNLFCHNCVHATAEGSRAGGLEDFFYELRPNYGDEGPAFTYESIFTPSALYSAIDHKINELRGWDHPFITPAPELKNEILWMHLASDDPYMPSIFPSTESVKLQSQYFQPSPSPLPQRGNFGGISLSKRAEMKLDLREIYGAVFDEKLQQIILVGQKSIQFPEMRLDDLAVAIQSIYGLKGRPPEDPGISIEPAVGKEEMIVRYLGATFDTEFGKVLFEGDYALKKLFLGLIPCHVPGFLSSKERRRMYEQIGPDLWSSRTWIVPDQISLAQSADGSAMAFETVKMRCLSENIADGKMLHFPPYEDFARHFTENYDAIAAEYPIFTEVKRLGQITGVVKWLKDNNIPFDFSFFESYGPNPCFTPVSIEMNKEEFSHISGRPLFLKGGIDLILNSQNFLTREESSINSFKKAVIETRPTEKSFSWDIDQALSAEAFPLFKTRKTGDFRKTFIDMQYPAPGELPFVLSRFYSSFNDQDVGLGTGWSLLPFELIFTPRMQISLNEISFEGYSHLLIREGNQQWVYQLKSYNPADGKVWYIREDQRQWIYQSSDRTFTLPLRGGGVVTFDEKGQLLHVSDRSQIKIEYVQVDGRLTTIRHQNGKEISLDYVDSRLVRARGPNQIGVLYSYDSQKQLAEISNLQGRSYQTYCYDKDLRLTHILSPQEEILFDGSYDEYNRLCSIKIGEKELKRDYNLAQNSSFLSSSDGIAVEGKYDQNYCLIGHRSGGKDHWEKLFQENQWNESTFDQEGHKDWEYIRDEQELLTKAIDPLGNTWKFFYDGEGRMIGKEDPRGDVTCFKYDEKGHLESKLEHAKNVWYDQTTKTITATGEEKYLTTYKYDDRLGRLRSLTVGADRTIFGYNENGLLTEISLPSGYVISREFDEKNRVKRISDKGGILKTFEYDEEDRIKMVTSLSGRTEYDYANNQMVKVIDAKGNRTKFRYEQGMLEAVEDAEGVTTKYRYGT